MRYFKEVIESVTAPQILNLWIQDGILKYFGSNGWTSLSSGAAVPTLEGGVVINDLKRNIANDLFALATGESTVAHGYASATFNENTVANNDAESAFGRWNYSHDGLDYSDLTLFSVGIGTGEIPANAFEIMSNGDVYLKDVGGYNGTNANGVDVLTLQDVILAGGGVTPKPLDVFDASPLYDAYISSTPITEEFKTALIDAVLNNALVYIANDNKKGFSFKVVVVFAGKTDTLIDFTASDHVAHYKISVDLGTNNVTLLTVDIIKKYIFNIADTPETNAENLRLATLILFNKVETVCVVGSLDGVEYNTLGIYSNGYITTMQENHYTVFSVNFESGRMEVLTKANVSTLVSCAELLIGNEESVKLYNIEHLPIGSFFVKLNYGFGVGTFQSGEGGFAHVTSAYGNEVFYDIAADGAITKNAEYIKPNEPYTLRIEASLIGTKLEDVISSALKRAGEVVVITTSGPITYTRTTDSNENMVYFTDDKKDGQTTLLIYNNTTKMLLAADVPMKRASLVEVGGITLGAAIEDASPLDAVNKFNALLAELRKSGVIAQ